MARLKRPTLVDRAIRFRREGVRTIEGFMQTLAHPDIVPFAALSRAGRESATRIRPHVRSIIASAGG